MNHQTDSSQEAPARSYTLQEAAVLLGISVNTLRRKLEAGQIQGERVSRPQGYAWRVHLTIQPPSNGQRSQEAPQPATGTLQQPPALALQAEAMGNLVAPLIQQAIAPLVQELAAARQQVAGQAEQLGQLHADLRHAREELARLQAPQPATSWWRRLLTHP